ncbi:hypothetical protein [Streptomyces canus]|uniref:hypothetical protein n=1 Tax=Streptomyces canus TaxID=58343 RepID=UPI002DDBA7EA|nr:hypothetical protein [Streptomyces canus]WSD82904.1 hypothetical protein OG925_00360 [Streptomyces canus]WSD91930.1 hypothetical protein OG925_50120 [Streptomyces canus]WSD92581.1 hypothetical protein OG925_50840 [Streptomyces canus]
MAGKNDNCSLLTGQAWEICESEGKDDNPCRLVAKPMRALCEEDHGLPSSGGSGTGGGITDGASEHVKDLANSLIKAIKGLVAPGRVWAPENADSGIYQPFLWLGQHLAVAIFVCVVVVCGLTAWQGIPRLRQMGASTGWTLAAVAGMAAVPGAVMMLNKAVSAAFTAAFNSNESTLFNVIRDDLAHGADSGNPLAILLITSALVVALAPAALVFLTRNLGILAFVCLAPLVLASLARGGDTTAVKTWAMRLLGLMFCPFALLLVSPFVELAHGSLVVDTVLLLAADALMLRMVFHGIPYFGPKVARGARTLVERRTDNRMARAVVRAGAPDFYERENAPRPRRTVDTPGRAAHQDRGVLLAAYGIRQTKRPGRLTTQSAVTETTRDADRRAQLRAARGVPGPRTQRQPAPAPNGQAPPPPSPASRRPSTP